MNGAYPSQYDFNDGRDYSRPVEPPIERLDPFPIKKSESVPIVARQFALNQLCSYPPRAFLYGNHTARKFISITASAGGVGKSTLTIAEAVAFASGKNFLSNDLRESGGAWYLGLEDPRDEYERRVAACMTLHGISQIDIDGKLFLNCGRENDFIIARELKSGVIVCEPVVNGIKKNIREKNIALLVVDPFASSHAVSENDNIKIEAVLKTWANIAEETNCSVELVMHSRKGHGAHEPSADDLRGASAMPNRARSVRALQKMTEMEATRAGIKPALAFAYVKTVSVKANNSPPPEKATWFKIESVDFHNCNDIHPSDKVGAIKSWDWPDCLDGYTKDDTKAIQQKISAGEWRENPQANDWAGYAIAEVLDLDPTDQQSKEKIKAILKRLTNGGALKVIKREDSQRKKKDFVEIGELL